MAPIRRYLRITKYSVLECRIYLENPALAQTWLLNPRDAVLPKVIEAVRPLVLPKLREERERARSKKGAAKKKSIKDVVASGDFEVSIFLTETSTRHTLLAKHKHFRDKRQSKLKSNSSKLTGGTNDAPIDVDAVSSEAGRASEGGAGGVPNLLVETSDDEAPLQLSAIPAAPDPDNNEGPANAAAAPRHPKRRRTETIRGSEDSDDGVFVDSDADVEAIDTDLDDGSAVEWDDDNDNDDDTDNDIDDKASSAGSDPGGIRAPRSNSDRRRKRQGRACQHASKRLRTASTSAGGPEVEEDSAGFKKKMAMDISYEGFSIYGRVLCLVVKRHSETGTSRTKTGAAGTGAAGEGVALAGGQAMMENWITSTQMPVGEDMMDAAP